VATTTNQIPIPTMHRLLPPLSLVFGLLAVPAAAQCFDPNVLGTFVLSGDEGHSIHLPLGFAFPMAGSTGTWTHVRVSPNGWLVLTDGVNSNQLPSPAFLPSVTPGASNSLYGPTGSNPRIAPYWTDLDTTGSGGVFIDTAGTSGHSARITWWGARAFQQTHAMTIQVELYATGEVRMRYTDLGPTNRDVLVGLSAADGTGAQPDRDLMPGPATTQVPGIHEFFTLPYTDLEWLVLKFTPQGSGWREEVICGLPAQHTAYGTSCAPRPVQGIYQEFGTAAQAASALTHNGLQLAIAGDSYAATWLPFAGMAIQPPSGNANWLLQTDDGSQLLPLPYPMPTPDGPVTTLCVNSNGIVHFGNAAASPHDGDFTPSGAEFAASPLPGIYCWHDFHDVQGGDIYYEMVGSTLYLTWWMVESYASPETANPSTLQYQFDLSTGTVRLLFGAQSPVSTSPRGSGYVVGFKGPGPVADPGSTPLSTSLPGTFRYHVPPAMTLSANGLPLSSWGAGSMITYEHGNVPELSPGNRLGFTILSLGQNLAGTSLTPLGLPGCMQYVASVDSTIWFFAASPLPTTNLTLPPGLPSGLMLYAQGAALVPPGPWNALGVTVSNAVASRIGFR
jgi:hypothetical protein